MLLWYAGLWCRLLSHTIIVDHGSILASMSNVTYLSTLFVTLVDMKERKKVIIIAPVGLAGAGKTMVVDYLTEKGFPRIHVGGFVVQGLEDRGVEVTPDNERAYREAMREEHGQAVFMEMAIDQIERLIASGQRNIVIHGLYSWTEYRLLKHTFPGDLTVIAVVAPKLMRKQRMAKRSLRPLTSEQVDQRDWSEIENIEKGGPIAAADYFIQNDSIPESLYQQIDAILTELGS